MVDHLVVLAVREGASQEEVEDLISSIRALRDEVPSTADLSVGEDFSGRSGGYTHALFARFEDTAGLQEYLLISAKIAKRSLVGSVPMDNLLSKEATDWREGRRLRAFELKQQGWTQQRIAEALGVSKGAVSQWMRRAREGGGAEALKRRPAPGARPRLSEQQRMKLPELLERGAEAHGFRGDVWTCERVARVIRREFSGSATTRLT